MKKILLFFLFFSTLHTKSFSQIVSSRMNEVFKSTTLSAANVLDNPWEIIYGPDGYLWITESRGYKVYRMDPTTGAKTMVLDISRSSNFLKASDRPFNLQFNFSGQGNPQGGLAGMAIHPDFMDASNPKKYVYISYIHKYVSTAANSAGVFFINQVVRFTYNTTTLELESPVSLCDTLPGSSDHNSQRMIIAPVNGTNYLFYAAGDMGAGQFGNKNRPQNAQNEKIYEGKILRFNLEPDGDAGTLDKWIPNDNPFNIASPAKQSAVWSVGIRNNQGFAYDSIKGILYGSSHGPYSDDEINIIESSKNYGHPLVIGYNDGNYDGSSAGATGGSTCPLIVSESANALSIGSTYKDPVFSAYPRTKAEINAIYLNNGSNANWPSEGWSGMEWYNNSIIPGWKNSLLLAGLKWGRVIRTKLNAAGNGITPTYDGVTGTVEKDTVGYFDSDNRFRDMAFGPGGKDMYIIMDKSAATSGPSSNNPSVVACPGCVIKYTFLGYNTVSGTSAIPSTIPIAAGKLNNCENANTVTVNATNSNNNLWVPITDTNSNVIAEINANGNNLGNVTTSIYVNGSGTVRENGSTKVLYADRNITITPQTQPSSNVSIRLYISSTEYTALKNGINSLAQPSGITAIGDLTIFKNNDACGNSLSAAPTKFTATNSGTQGSSGYYIQTDIPSFSTFYFANKLSILPVKLVSFSGKLLNGVAQLQWITDIEAGTKYYKIERSADGKIFDSIGMVAAKNLTGKQAYMYEDAGLANISGGKAYYRLKMVDADRNYNYSHQIAIYLPILTSKITVRPNPVQDVASIQILASANEKINWQLIDNTGKLIYQNQLNVHKGENNLQINMQQLGSGMYYLKVSGNSISQTIKIQKQ